LNFPNGLWRRGIWWSGGVSGCPSVRPRLRLPAVLKQLERVPAWARATFAGGFGGMRGRALEWLRTVPRAALRSLLSAKPLDWAQAASAALVLALFLYWFRRWYHGNEPALFDPLLHADDAHTAIFPFHRYTAGAPLADDPIATEMLEYQPYAYRWLFRLFMPFGGVLLATKFMQAVLFGIILIAGLVIARSPRGGLGAGLLFSFFFIHDQYVQNRILGGLPRGFGFPVVSLWIAGAIAGRPKVRWAAALLGALSYPTALAMVLASEGIYALRRLGRPGWWTTLRRLRNYAILVAACGALLAPAVLFGMSDGGPIHTLEQAKREPAFSGRLKILPFGDPGKEFGTTLSQVYSSHREGESPYPHIKEDFDKHGGELAVAMLALFILLPIFGLTGNIGAVTAFIAANLVLYALSRFFAFHLYSPERYYSVGMRAGALALAAASIGLVAPSLRHHWRYLVRNLASAAMLVFVWVAIGDGVRNPPMGVDVDYRLEAPLWDFIKKLPKSTRVASHIMDGNEIPLFTARATNGTSETIQPWLTLSWKRQKTRAQDTLSAMYATKRETVLSFAKKYRVSHLLVNRNRYHQDFRSKTKSFEPFTSFANQLVSGVKLSDLVLEKVPAEAIVFKKGRWQLIDVKLLERAWAKGGEPAAPADAEDTEPEPEPKQDDDD
jgi:hypothetical protein